MGEKIGFKFSCTTEEFKNSLAKKGLKNSQIEDGNDIALATNLLIRSAPDGQLYSRDAARSVKESCKLLDGNTVIIALESPESSSGYDDKFWAIVKELQKMIFEATIE